MTTTTRFDVEALLRSHAEHDARLRTSLYTEDAQATVIDANNPPSRPRELRGKEQVGELWQDIMSRDMTHEIQNVIEAGDRVAYQLACRYPDGNRVVALFNAELRDGRIAREVMLQAWDG